MIIERIHEPDRNLYRDRSVERAPTGEKKTFLEEAVSFEGKRRENADRHTPEQKEQEKEEQQAEARVPKTSAVPEKGVGQINVVA